MSKIALRNILSSASILALGLVYTQATYASEWNDADQPGGEMAPASSNSAGQQNNQGEAEAAKLAAENEKLAREIQTTLQDFQALQTILDSAKRSTQNNADAAYASIKGELGKAQADYTKAGQVLATIKNNTVSLDGLMAQNLANGTPTISEHGKKAQAAVAASQKALDMMGNMLEELTKYASVAPKAAIPAAPNAVQKKVSDIAKMFGGSAKTTPSAPAAASAPQPTAAGAPQKPGILNRIFGSKTAPAPIPQPVATPSKSATLLNNLTDGNAAEENKMFAPAGSGGKVSDLRAKFSAPIPPAPNAVPKAGAPKPANAAAVQNAKPLPVPPIASPNKVLTLSDAEVKKPIPPALPPKTPPAVIPPKAASPKPVNAPSTVLAPQGIPAAPPLPGGKATAGTPPPAPPLPATIPTAPPVAKGIPTAPPVPGGNSASSGTPGAGQPLKLGGGDSKFEKKEETVASPKPLESSPATPKPPANQALLDAIQKGKSLNKTPGASNIPQLTQGKLTPAQLKAMTPAQFAKLTETQLANLTKEQLGVVSQTQVKALSAKQQLSFALAKKRTVIVEDNTPAEDAVFD